MHTESIEIDWSVFPRPDIDWSRVSAPRPRIDPKARLLANVEPEPNTGCWLWTGGLCGSGYGIARSETQQIDKAHRIFYRLFVGPTPKGFMVCHHCDTPLCVNPDHLFLGTAKDNAQDMIRKGRQHDQRRTHCFKGHELTAENTYEYHDLKRRFVRRSCRRCMRASHYRWLERQQHKHAA